MAMLPARLIKNLIMIPVQIIIIKAVWNYIIRPLRNIYSYDTI